MTESKRGIVPFSLSHFITVTLVIIAKRTARSVWRSQTWKERCWNSVSMVQRKDCGQTGNAISSLDLFKIKNNPYHSRSLLFLTRCTAIYRKCQSPSWQVVEEMHWCKKSIDSTVQIVCLVHSYRKIPGNKCEGGQVPDRKEINLRQRCVSDILGPELLVSTSYMT